MDHISSDNISLVFLCIVEYPGEIFWTGNPVRVPKRGLRPTWNLSEILMVAEDYGARRIFSVAYVGS
jgi:hypothetical protein